MNLKQCLHGNIFSFSPNNATKTGRHRGRDAALQTFVMLEGNAKVTNGACRHTSLRFNLVCSRYAEWHCILPVQTLLLQVSGLHEARNSQLLMRKRSEEKKRNKQRKGKQLWDNERKTKRNKTEQGGKGATWNLQVVCQALRSRGP